MMFQAIKVFLKDNRGRWWNAGLLPEKSSSLVSLLSKYGELTCPHNSNRDRAWTREKRQLGVVEIIGCGTEKMQIS